jgi:hypothetical protein
MIAGIGGRHLAIVGSIAALCAYSQNANAAPVITAGDSGSVPFAVYNVGTATTAGLQNQTTISNPGFDGIQSITFTGTGGNVSGVYAGSVSGVALSLFTLGNTGGQPLGCPGSSCADYFAAQPSTTTSGGVTISWGTNTQTALYILWGSVDAGTNYNIVTTNGATTDTITGTQILAALGNPPSGQYNAWVEITGLDPFTSATFTDTDSGNPAFEFDIGQTPIPAALPLFAGGLGLLGLLGWRRNRRNGIQGGRLQLAAG